MDLFGFRGKMPSGVPKQQGTYHINTKKALKWDGKIQTSTLENTMKEVREKAKPPCMNPPYLLDILKMGRQQHFYNTSKLHKNALPIPPTPKKQQS